MKKLIKAWGIDKKYQNASKRRYKPNGIEIVLKDRLG